MEILNFSKAITSLFCAWGGLTFFKTALADENDKVSLIANLVAMIFMVNAVYLIWR